MKWFWVFWGLLASGQAGAQGLQLDLPIDCRLGETCFIQQYMDHDAGPEAVDFTCGGATYDGHKGTDIRLPTAAEMKRGVNVLAAAGGVVIGLRDGMADHRLQTAQDRARIAGRECGNGVMIRHPFGWRTQYCHMKKGSVRVKKGDVLQTGAVLGQVGLSGNTQFPHVHIGVYKGKQIIDPFSGPRVNACGAKQAESLWNPAISGIETYQPTRIIKVGFAAQKVSYNRVLDGDYSPFTRRDPARPLVAYGLGINLEKGDRLRVVLSGPKGKIAEVNGAKLPRAKAQWMSYTGRKAPRGGWPSGIYTARSSVIRAGREVSSITEEISFD